MQFRLLSPLVLEQSRLFPLVLVGSALALALALALEVLEVVVLLLEVVVEVVGVSMGSV